MRIRFPDLSPKLNKILHHVEKNAHYALAVALTKTAEHTRDAERQLLHKKYIIRSTWVSNGVKCSPASKGEKSPTARVGFVRSNKPTAPIAQLHESGGTHEKASKHRTAIPSDNVRGTGRKGKTTPGLWARAFRNKKGKKRAFELHTAKGDYLVQVTGIEFARRKITGTKRWAKGTVGKGKNQRSTRIGPSLGDQLPARTAFKFLYKLVPSTKIEPDLKFYEMTGFVTKVFAVNIVKCLHDALKERAA